MEVHKEFMSPGSVALLSLKAIFSLSIIQKEESKEI